MSGNKIRCDIGGEWNERSAYSQSALRKYQKKLSIRAATPTHSTISCSKHGTGAKVPEMQCEGPCDKFRPLECFSKSSRRNKKNWCKDCTDWTEHSEVGEALPPPGAKVWAGELDTLKTRASQFMLEDEYEDGIPVGTSTSGASVIIEEDDKEEEFTLLPPGSQSDPYTSAASIEAFDAPKLGPVATPTARMEPSAHAPHWFLGALTGNSSASATPSTPLALDTVDPLDTLDGAMSELSMGSGSQTMATSANTNASGYPGQTGAVFFNAWGPEGEHMRRVKQPTIVSDGTSQKEVVRTAKGPRIVSTRTAPKIEVRKGGWVKTSTRRTAPSLPDYLKYDSFHGEEDLAANIVIDEA